MILNFPLKHFQSWLNGCRRYLVRVVLLTLVITFILLNYLYSNDDVVEDIELHGLDASKQGINLIKFRRQDRSNNYQLVDDLQMRIEDLRRIKLSVIDELKEITREKSKLLKEKANLAGRNEKLLNLISRSKSQLKQLELDISANRRQKLEKNCDINRVAPIIFNPMKSIDIINELTTTNKSIFHYDIINPLENNESKYTFDLSQCPITRDFKFHLVISELADQLPDNHGNRVDPLNVKDILQSHRQHTDNINEACLLISIHDTESNISDMKRDKNNLVIDIRHHPLEILPTKSAIASATFKEDTFRENIDLVLPSIWQEPSIYDTIVGSIPPQSPIDRKYLASYFGGSANNNSMTSQEKILQIIHRNSIDDLFLFIYNCGLEEYPQCYEEKEKMIELSTFLIIIPDKDKPIDENANELLYLALSRGTIPVVIGRERTRLPFDKVLDWNRASILLHSARLTELHFILRSISIPDLYQMKYHGRHIFENYLATTKQILETIISIYSIRHFDFPPTPIEDVDTSVYYTSSQLIIDENCTTSICQETKASADSNLLFSEILGPRERPFRSQSFRRNFSLVFNSARDLWNNPLLSPFHLYPSLPQDPITPSEYKFVSSDLSFRTINDGLGGSGNEFARALGGDYPNEQFTIVLLTYERISILMRTLERLKGVSYLNKVLVIWNGINNEPPANLIWPDIGAPIVLVKVEQNSLNNRFIPFDTIETDAILSLDDDSPLRPDEIVFGFRVWRQSRDRIVGFPGRFHAWDNSQASWMYNSNHSCELSMVLTGGAFFHKYYSYLYTYNMPQTIRSIVDKFMNCEDIAMNFLVAHLTRKPPIKVTSRWTFHCPGCQSSLSEEESHFQERHECLNTFASIYGYMPLLNTQHRSDSVLFKTRLPHDKQKCFKFV